MSSALNSALDLRIDYPKSTEYEARRASNQRTRRLRRFSNGGYCILETQSMSVSEMLRFTAGARAQPRFRDHEARGTSVETSGRFRIDYAGVDDGASSIRLAKRRREEGMFTVPRCWSAPMPHLAHLCCQTSAPQTMPRPRASATHLQSELGRRIQPVDEQVSD